MLVQCPATAVTQALVIVANLQLQRAIGLHGLSDSHVLAKKNVNPAACILTLLEILGTLSLHNLSQPWMTGEKVLQGILQRASQYLSLGSQRPKGYTGMPV